MKLSYAQSVILSLCILLPAGSSTLGNPVTTKCLFANSAPVKSHGAKADLPSQTFPCLPKDVRPDEVVSYGPKGTQGVTVEKKLIGMKARCRSGKLVDAKRREIRFFRPSCWGNPPPDYLEIRQRENQELEQLKKRYSVIAFGCNPMIQ